MLRPTPIASAASMGLRRSLSTKVSLGLDCHRWKRLQYDFDMTRRNHWDALADVDTGRLDRVMMHDLLVKARRVELRGAALVFESPVGRHTLRRFTRKGVIEVPTVRVRRDLLEQFLSLSTDQSILRFARAYGSLRGFGATDDFVLRKQQRSFSLVVALAGLDKRSRQMAVGDEFEEPLDVWRHCRDRFDALLALAAGWKEGAPGLLVIERVLSFGMDGIREANLAKLNTPIARQKEAASMLSRWAQSESRSIHLRPSLRFRRSTDPHQPIELVFTDHFSDYYGFGISLYGALVVQMLSAVTGSGFVTCSSCGSAFVPARRPTQDRRRYCRNCGRKAALRDAKAAQRQRERQIRESDSKDG